ncbi:GH43 family beta-xylosidase [Virgibacillus natechei]|uniref:GH43 family beta-xylosidase n=1 Tax=Virgibacillus natechei TaxID=1216297 RepID=A0ABS4IEA7_9BACI|nr:family 43 glycosylhydrolase [Virgibacillus natechei]MBP1969280.1 GH43 family beta-xylosidase [Virgibacillus natechei]UZD12435.1 family 43 glycosylhydrolase [Virgibacillus natechei]
MNIKSVEKIELTTKIGVPPQMPNQVSAELNNGVHTELQVLWDKPHSELFAEPGKVTVEGKIKTYEYPNPLIEQRADPYIYKHTDGYYYFTGSYPEYDRIILRRAKTIKELANAEEKAVWRKRGSGIMSIHIWAPELHFIDGKWYIHYAAGDRDDVWAIRPYVLENSSEDPFEGEWVEKGQINTDFQSFSLDATTFEHKGKRYLIWAQKVDYDTISNLYIAEMSNPWTIKGEQVVLSTPEFNWEQEGFYVNEGAAVIKRNGKVFVAFSASATDDRYVMGLLSADEDSDLLNPKSWTKSKEPVFVSNEETKEYGPGHNSFTVAEDGVTDLLVYHARPYKGIEGNPLYDHNRHARVQQMFWKTDGTPYFGSPGQTIKNAKQKITATITVE